MDWLIELFSSSKYSFLAAAIPALLIVLFFSIAARKAHLKHIERIKNIKKNHLFFEEE